LPVVLNGYETWSFALMVEHRLRGSKTESYLELNGKSNNGLAKIA
jgi:hypothetical protein